MLDLTCSDNGIECGGRRRWRVLAAALLAAGLGSGAARGDVGQIVRIGVYQNRPKVFTNEQGRASGLFMDLFAAVADAEGWRPVYVPCTWAEGLEALAGGRIDLLPDVAYSPERDERLDFHRLPVAESFSRLYAGPHRRIAALSDLEGRSVALLQGSIQEKEFELLMGGLTIAVTLVPVDSFEQAFRLAADGTVDAAVANHFFGDYFCRAYGLVKTPIVFQMAQLYFATAGGNNGNLLSAIDRHLRDWRQTANSPYYLALARWTEQPVARLWPRYLRWAMALAGGMLALAGVLIAVLRQQVRKRTRHLLMAREELKNALIGGVAAVSATAEKRDAYTAGHQSRVADLARALAESLGLDRHRAEGTYLAGIIHDIGKISVPVEILAKKEALTAEEVALIRQHPRTGYDILSPIKFPWPIAEIVYQHHERADGSGYPRGLAGQDILFEARILAVADTVETMALRRPYREALGIDAALAEIAGQRGVRYDARVVDACLALFRDGKFRLRE